MSVYAKVTIAIIVLFAAVLGVYYGFGSPGTGIPLPPRDAQEVDSSREQLTPTDPAATDVEAAFAKAEANDPGRVLSESVERAIGPGSPASKTDAVSSGVLATDAMRFTRRGDVIPVPDPRDLSEPVEDPWAPGSLTMTSDLTADRSGGTASADRLSSGVAALPTAVAPPLPPRYIEYRVKPDDSLWTIAEEWLGDGSRWDLIARVNPLVNPDRLRIGQKLRLPPKDVWRPRVERRSSGVRTAGTLYTVQVADTLTKIANAYYNDPSKWQIIYDANRHAIGSNPDRLSVGMRLRIPPRQR